MSEVTVLRTMEIIAAEINTIKEQTRQTLLSGALEIGKRLIEAKALVPYGTWGRWLEENVDYSERTAQNLMKCYEEYGKKGDPQALADLSYTKAVALLALPGELRAEILENGTAGNLSVRELQEEIARLKAENDARQLRLDDLLREADKATEAERTAEALRAEAKAAKDQAAADQQRASDAIRRANESAKEVTALKARVQELESAPPEIEREIVEVVPQNVQDELSALRRRLADAPNAAVVRLRAGFERLTAEFRAVETLLQEVAAVDAAEAARYAVAVRKACENMSARLEGGAKA